MAGIKLGILLKTKNTNTTKKKVRKNYGKN